MKAKPISMDNIVPLTVLSFMLDGLGGIWPFRFHLTNTILHVVNSLLAYLLCLNLGLEAGRNPGRTAICRTSHPCRSRRRHNIWARRSIGWPVFSNNPAPVHLLAQPGRGKVLRIGPRGILSRLALQRKRDSLTGAGHRRRSNPVPREWDTQSPVAAQRALGWLHRDFCPLSNHAKSRCGPGILSRKYTRSQQPTHRPAPRPQTLDSRRTLLEILHSHFVSHQIIRRLLLQRHTPSSPLYSRPKQQRA